MDRPIIFSAPMVRALLEGRKAQTRRIIKPQPWDQAEMKEQPRCSPEGWQISGHSDIWTDAAGDIFENWRCPYGRPGDKLWVKEACGRRASSFLGIEATNGVESAFYKADHSDVLSPDDFTFCPWWSGPTLSPIHMPRWASRLTLEVTEVRVQRLHEISEEDARAEGCSAEEDPYWRPSFYDPDSGGDPSFRKSFEALWESIHGEGSWATNPWIWAVSFSPLPPSQSAAPERAASLQGNS